MEEHERGISRSQWPSHHGGWPETLAKVAYGLLLAGLILVPNAMQAENQPPEKQLTDAQADAIVDEALAIRLPDHWTVQQVVAGRNRLVILRDQLSEYDYRRDIVARKMRAFVDQAFTSLGHAKDEAMTPEARQRVYTTQSMLLQELQASRPTADMQPVDVVKVCTTIATALLVAYLLFIPFALAIFAFRLRRFGHAIADEIVYGWKNILFSAVAWPVGMASYPGDTALAIRRRRIEAEYRARVGKTHWREELTPADQRRIDILIKAPRAELARKLTEIADVPAAMLWKARFAAYAAVFVGFLLASQSSARAQSSGPITENRPVAAQVVEQPPVEVHGYLQVEAGAPHRPLTVPRVWVWGDAHPVSVMSFRLAADMVGSDHLPMLRDAWVRLEPEGWPVTFRLGQMINRAVFMAPAPFQQRLIGGPGAAAYLSFLDIGAEIAGQHGWFGWAVEVMSGTGPNTPDNNDGKDVMASVALGPFGPLTFQLAFQAGEQPDGLRTRAAGHAQFVLDTVTLDALGTHQMVDGHTSWAASGMIGWRIHQALDLAAGYDEVHPASDPVDRVVRAQATMHVLNDHLQLGAAYQWSRLGGHAGICRLQLGF